MAWHTPDRPEEHPIDPRALGYRKISAVVVAMIVSALACAWVLAVRWDVLEYSGPPWLWIGANAVAPYAGLALGGLAALAGLLDKLFGGYFETHLGKGLAALVLAVLVLWPRYAPSGVLVYSTTETLRGEGRVLLCVYLRLDADTEEVMVTGAPRGRVCPRFNWPH